MREDKREDQKREDDLNFLSLVRSAKLDVLKQLAANYKQGPRWKRIAIHRAIKRALLT